MKTQILKPGILVALSTRMRGGVAYSRVDLNASDIAIPEGAEVARWETKRVIDDAEEHERGVKARGKARSLITAVTIPSSFGLLCPTDREGMLNEAFAQARQIVKEFNDGAKSTRIDVFVLKGRIASTDEESVQAIADEVKELLSEMEEGISDLSVDRIRDAAQKAKSMTAMLEDDQARAVASAVDQARKAARAIVKRVEKEGEDGAIVLQDLQRGEIEKARMMMLDLSDAPLASAPEAPAVNMQRFAALETEHADTDADAAE